MACPINCGRGEPAKDGQQTCHDENGNVIDCSGTGQDGDIQAGVEWPSPRFVDNGDGTVTDNLTGLIWLKNANCAGDRTWYDALTYCNILASRTCGLSDGSVAGDWHLPNIIELESLVNAEESNPDSWLNTQGFTNVRSSQYWSASTCAYNTSRAWKVVVGGGGGVGFNEKSNSNYVWPVRGVQCGPNLSLKLPLPTEKSWLLTVEAGGKTLWGGTDPYHTGNGHFSLDFDDYTEEEGQLTDVCVLAAGSGEVKESGYRTGWGYTVKIDHDSPYNGTGYATRYAHLKEGSLLVEKGDWASTLIRIDPPLLISSNPPRIFY